MPPVFTVNKTSPTKTKIHFIHLPLILTKRKGHVCLRVWGYLCMCACTHTYFTFPSFNSDLLRSLCVLIPAHLAGRPFHNVPFRIKKTKSAQFENRQWKPYGGLEKKGTEGKTQRERDRHA